MSQRIGPYVHTDVVVFTNVPANEEGRAFIAALKQYGSDVQLRVRGRHTDRKGLGEIVKLNTNRDVPAAHAQRFSVYVTQGTRPMWLKRDSQRSWRVRVTVAGKKGPREIWLRGFKTMDAALAARDVTQGVSK